MSDLATRRRIYRSAALDRLSSPEQLDALIPITRPRAWLALTALWLGVLALVAWSVAGRIATRVVAEGVILGESPVDVTPAWDGQVAEMLAAVGDTVCAGQVIARLAQPTLQEAIRQQQARIADVEAELRQRSAAADSTAVLQRRFYKEQRRSLEASMREQALVTQSLEQRVLDERPMREQGLVSRDAALQLQMQLNAAREALARTRGELAQVSVAALGAEATVRTTAAEARRVANDATRELQRLEQELARRAVLRAPVDGVVLERLVDEGDVLVPGQPAARIQRTVGADSRLRALLYVSGDQAKRVLPGMDVQIAPSNVRPEEHGYLVATVRRITALPASSQALRQTLRNDALVGTVATMRQPFQIEADLTTDPASPSGYRWTSVPGPAIRLDVGTVAQALVVVERRSPIDLVLPTLRRALHLP